MWFWWFMLCCGLLTPVILLVAGRLMWKHPPKNINTLVGYRSTRSMKNAETWRFAHEYCGKLWWKIGWLLLLPSAAAFVPFYGQSDDTVGLMGSLVMITQIVILILSVFPTEKALKNTFHEDGTRR